jgi:uncharacterized iron-regulated membrane protein
MRNIHRWVSVPAGMFLGLIGITGVYLQSDLLLEHYFPAQKSDTQAMSMDEVPRFLENSLARMRRSAPGARIASIELSARGGVPHADVIFADPAGRTRTFDARSGELSAQPVGDPLQNPSVCVCGCGQLHSNCIKEGSLAWPEAGLGGSAAWRS